MAVSPSSDGGGDADSSYSYSSEGWEGSGSGWGSGWNWSWNWSAWPRGPLGRCAWELSSSSGETDWEASFWLLPALYVLVFVLGLSGNGLVLATVCRAPLASSSSSSSSWGSWGARRRSTAEAYLGNLALADLAFVVTLPLWAAYTGLRFHWPFGAALCKLSSYLVLLNMFASAFCLAGLSLERYLAVARALPPPPSSSSSSSPAAASRPGRLPAGLALAAVWLAAGLLALPALLLREARPSGPAAATVECDLDLSGVASSPEEEGYWLAGLSLAATALAFVVPLLLMSLCYVGLGAAVSRHFRRGGRAEGKARRRLLRLLVSLVAVFAACWLPFHLLKSLYVVAWLGLLEVPCAALALVLRLHPYATCLAYLNSCLNPFLYAFFDPRFRGRCRRLLGLPRGPRGPASRQGAPLGGPGPASGSSTLSGHTPKSSEAPSLGTKL